MRPRFVVVHSPRLDFLLRIVQGEEPVQVQTLVPEGPIEALDEAILDWLARLNVVNPDVPGVGPGIEGPAGELRSIVGHDDLRQAALLPEPLEHFDDPHCGNRVRHMDRQALSAELVHDREASKAPTVAQRVRDEVHAPPLVWPPERLADRPWRLAAAPLALSAHRQTFFTVEPLIPFAVHQPPLPLKERVDLPVAPTWSLGCQLPYPSPKLLLRVDQALVAHGGARKAGEANCTAFCDAVCGLDLLDDAPPLACRHDLFPKRSLSTWRFNA